MTRSSAWPAARVGATSSSRSRATWCRRSRRPRSPRSSASSSRTARPAGAPGRWRRGSTAPSTARSRSKRARTRSRWRRCSRTGRGARGPSAWSTSGGARSASSSSSSRASGARTRRWSSGSGPGWRSRSRPSDAASASRSKSRSTPRSPRHRRAEPPPALDPLAAAGRGRSRAGARDALGPRRHPEPGRDAVVGRAECEGRAGRAGRTRRRFAAILAAAAAVACQPPQALRQMLYTEEPMDQPPLVLVYDFAVNPEDVVVDFFGPACLPVRAGGAENPDQARDDIVANTPAAAMVEKLRARGIRAERAGARTTPPREAILVKGQFVTVNQEPEAPRMAIGLGPDSSMLRIQVQAYQVADNGALRRIAEREVGGVGIIPAVMPSESATVAPRPTTSAVVTGGLTFVLRSQANVEADAERLAELFAERAFDFYRRQGWL